jgi:hypothetical protein
MIKRLFRRLGLLWPEDVRNCGEVLEKLRGGYLIVSEVWVDDCVYCLFHRLERGFRELNSDYEKAVGLREMELLARQLGGFFRDIFRQRVRRLAELYNIDCRALYATKPLYAVLAYYKCRDRRQLAYVRAMDLLWRDIVDYIEGRREFPDILRPKFHKIYEPCMEKR